MRLGVSQQVEVGAGQNPAAVLALVGALSLQAMQLGLTKGGYLSKAFAQVQPRLPEAWFWAAAAASAAAAAAAANGDCSALQLCSSQAGEGDCTCSTRQSTEHRLQLSRSTAGVQGLLAMPGVALPMPVCAPSMQGVAEGIPCNGVGHYEAEGRPLEDRLPERWACSS